MRFAKTAAVILLLIVVLLLLSWLWCRKQICILVFKDNIFHSISLNRKNLQQIFDNGLKVSDRLLVYPNTPQGERLSPGPREISQRAIIVRIKKINKPSLIGQPVLADQRTGKNKFIGWAVENTYPTHLELQLLLLDPDGAVTTIKDKSYNNSQVAFFTALRRTVPRISKASNPDILSDAFNLLKL